MDEASATNLAAHIDRVPKTCFWEITEACNLRCIHCEAEAGVRDRNELSLDEGLKLVDDLAAIGCRRVHLTGGEPLVRPDWPELAARAVDRGMQAVVITNGLLLDEAAVERMVALGVTAVSVSIDGLKAEHDAIRVGPGGQRTGRSSFDAAVGAVRRAAASPLKVGIITQVHRRNLDQLDRLYQLAARLGADVWQVQIAMPLGRLWDIRYRYLLSPGQIPELVRRLTGLIADGRVTVSVADNIGYYGRHEPALRGGSAFWPGCMAGVRLVALRSNGDVNGCPSHPASPCTCAEPMVDGQRPW